MMESEDDLFCGYASGEEVIDDAEVGGVLFDPDFAVFDAEVQDDVLDEFFIVPAEAEPEVLVSVGVENEAIANFP